MEGVIGIIGAIVLLIVLLHEYLGEKESEVKEVLVVAHLRDGEGETIERKKHKLSHEEYRKYLQDEDS